MQLTTPSPAIARAGLRALKTVALADGVLHPLERALLEGAQRYILASSFDVDALETISAEELAAEVAAPELRERILMACMLTALIDGEASTLEGEVLDAFAGALGVHGPALEDVRRLIDRHLLVARVDIARRSFLGQRARAYLSLEGVRGFARTLRGVLGIEDRALATRYLALERLPPGTLGREYFEFIRRSGFALPGEKGGAPEVIVFHDCLHVLAGYQTDSLEETQIASFQAGILRKDPVYGLLFMLAQFHLGVQITPVTPAEKLAADPGLMLAAFVRGTKVTRDLCVDWVPQDDFARSVEELRSEYGIQPRGFEQTDSAPHR